MKQKKKIPIWPFIGIFVVLVTLTVSINLFKKDIALLEIPNNAGVSLLETRDSTLVCTFQDGRVVSWDWTLLQQQGDFKAVSDRVIILDSTRLASISTTGKKLLTLYNLPDGKKLMIAAENVFDPSASK